MNEKTIKAIIEAVKGDIARIAAEAAVETTLKEWEKKQKEKHQEQQNKRLWNTRMLLKHYHSLKDYCNNAIYDKETAKTSESPIEILESAGCCNKDMYIDSIKSSVIRTRTIMAHIDVMIDIYKVMCESSDREEDRRRYRVFLAKYINDEARDAICQAENMDKSTFYRDINCSTEILSSLIFGVDGLLSMKRK